MTTEKSDHKIGMIESIALMALLISLVALSIDVMLPALDVIGKELGVSHANDAQLIISTLVFGLSIGQLISGPLSDSMGRKAVILGSGGVFVIGCVVSLFSTSFGMMLTGRFLQGIGAAGPRAVVVASIRDQYEGRGMARIMSSIMAVFIIVPALAPTIGQGIITISGWRAIFIALLIQAVVALAWFGWRQPETLPPPDRRPFALKKIFNAAAEVCVNRIALGYTIVAGLILGVFLGYLNSAPQIFQGLYGLGTRFPLIFGILALTIGSASFFNARMVIRYGMRRLTATAMKMLFGLSVVYLALVFWMGGHSPLSGLMTYLILSFFCIGILFGNLNAIAMEPLGHIAGTGAAVVGSLSNLIAVPIAVSIGRCYNNTTLPLIGGFAFFSLLSLLIMGRVQFRSSSKH